MTAATYGEDDEYASPGNGRLWSSIDRGRDEVVGREDGAYDPANLVLDNGSPSLQGDPLLSRLQALQLYLDQLLELGLLLGLFSFDYRWPLIIGNKRKATR